MAESNARSCTVARGALSATEKGRKWIEDKMQLEAGRSASAQYLALGRWEGLARNKHEIM